MSSTPLPPPATPYPLELPLGPLDSAYRWCSCTLLEIRLLFAAFDCFARGHDLHHLQHLRYLLGSYLQHSLPPDRHDAARAAVQAVKKDLCVARVGGRPARFGVVVESTAHEA